ncbi:MAG: DUF3592 domain-containing protein, partial [Cyanobacteria bacterium P01_H01_bin.121]
MKALAIIKYVFTFVGIGMLVATYFFYTNTQTFLDSAIAAEGTVIELIRSRSNDSTTYRPIVQFTSPSGEPIEFVSSVGSNPPRYKPGQTVAILYNPENPQNARLDGFFALWGSSLILGGIGTSFTATGIGLWVGERQQRRKREYLQQFGTPIQTTLQSVGFDWSTKVNGRHPFQITSQWQDPKTSEIYIFRSQPIWFDPSDYIKDQSIKVLIAPDNPKKYYVDLSFL